MNKVMVAILNYSQDWEARSLHASITEDCRKVMVDSSGAWKWGMTSSEVPYYTGNFNKASELFLQSDCDYCLYVCSDITGDINAVIRSLQRLTPWITGVYSPFIEGRRSAHFYRGAKIGTGLQEALCVEGMCIAANRKVIEAVYPFANNIYGWGLDIFKCYTAKKLGLSVYIDTDVVVHHPPSSHYDRKKANADMLRYFGESQEQAFAEYLKELKRSNFPFYVRWVSKTVSWLRGKGWRMA